MAARYKSAFASASGFCSANAAQRNGASPAAPAKDIPAKATTVVAASKPTRPSVKPAKRAA